MILSSDGASVSRTLSRTELTALSKISGFDDLLALLSHGGTLSPRRVTVTIHADRAAANVNPRGHKASERVLRATVELRGRVKFSPSPVVFSDDPFVCGQQAAHDGLPREVNPHELGTPAFAQWAAGWREITELEE